MTRRPTVPNIGPTQMLIGLVVIVALFAVVYFAVKMANRSKS